MSILDINNNIKNDDQLIWDWLEKNVSPRYYTTLTNEKYIRIENGMINVGSSVLLKPDPKAGNFPDYIKFGSINGNFVCVDRNMTNLKGTPQTVLGCFDCRYNLIEDYKDGPKRVYGEYYRDYKVPVDKL